MALNIKNAEVVRLAAELAAMNGETKTEAIWNALKEREQRMALQGGGRNRLALLVHFLESDVWPLVPDDQIGRVLTQEETDELLGFGPEGV
ncbi:MAG: type II toxin-antitoxin system VapB family antitoxin [Myxococcota bacterium]|nr:type II toxin-antitoxin system VapB family antitoxin [Myxococcota bacterium]